MLLSIGWELTSRVARFDRHLPLVKFVCRSGMILWKLYFIGLMYNVLRVLEGFLFELFKKTIALLLVALLLQKKF